jgi:hypothetical protein
MHLKISIHLVWYVIIEILYFHFMIFKNDQIQGLFDN